MTFWDKVQIGQPNECWPWKLRLYRDGYALVRWKGGRYMAHRLAYFLTHEQWPEVALHSCDNRSCCNPAHIRSGTHRDNTQDCIDKGRFPEGNRSPHAKVTEEVVKELRRRKQFWGCRTAWAKEFGIHQTTVTEILANQTWKRVSP